MPKGKKKFIDRKTAVTFHVVHRSQQDPLINDEDAPQRVLLLSTGKDSKADEEQRKEEQKKWGIAWDDDYNYLQHLRGTDEATSGELVRYRIAATSPLVPEPQKNKDVKLKLPSSVFASDLEEDVGVLNLAAPHSGLRLDLDPDIVAAMDEDFDYDNPDNLLDDDFVRVANTESDGDGLNELDDIMEDSDTSSCGSVGSDELSDDDVASLNGPQFTFAEEETKSRFTNYSVSSSVIRRNEQLELLDNRFEKMFAGYDDSEIGALDCEEIEGYIPPNSDLMLQCAEEFHRQQAVQKHQAATDTSVRGIDVPASSEEENDMTDLDFQDNKEDRFDCESILSTYSNIYNHPKLITEPVVCKRIKVSARTGIPKGVLDGGARGRLTAKALARFDATSSGVRTEDRDGTESVISTLSVLSVRPKDETPEERRERKKALKDYRKERRLEKKANTLAFKEEKKRQEKTVLNAKANVHAVRIL